MSTTGTAPATARSHTKRRALAVAIATLAPVVVWLLAWAFGVDLHIDNPDDDRAAEELSVVFVLVIALVSALIGWGVLALLEKFTPRHAFTVWAVGAAVLLLLSFMPVAGIEATGGMKFALALMHVVTAAPLFVLFRRPNATAS